MVATIETWNPADESTADAIRETVENTWHAMYGLRVLTIVDDEDMTRPAPEVGDVLESSRVWDDGEMTEEFLRGTCAVQVDPDELDDVEQAVKSVARYWGRYIVLLGGSSYTYGTDGDEVILSDATVLRVWDRGEATCDF